MNLHVCIVSDQILPNLIPALMERPQHVVLVASAAMERRGLAKRLLSLLQERGVGGEIRAAAPEVELSQIQAYASELAADLGLKYAGATLTLNATGGTKLMTLAFVEAFRTIGARIIYTDTGHRRIEQISPTTELQPMGDVLDVPGYLAAQGIHYRAADSDSDEVLAGIGQRESLTRQWGGRVGEFEQAFTAVNGALARATERRPSQQDWPVCATFRKPPWRALQEILKGANAKGIARWQSGASEFQVETEASLRYLHGGWLEEYAYLCVREAQTFDLRTGVHIAQPERDQDKNEFDLLAAHRNQLLFIECKTANFAYERAKGNEVAYKIDSLGRLARGLFGATWLLCAIEPPQELRERAREYRIEVIGPGELPQLKSRVERWMAGNPN